MQFSDMTNTQNLDNNANDNRLIGTHVVLSTEKTKLVIPYDQVGTIQHLNRNTNWQIKKGTNGIFYTNTIDKKLFIALSDNLIPIETQFENRFIVMPFIEYSHDVLWCWESAKLITNVNLPKKPLPSFMLLPNSPITGFVEYEGDILFPCDANALIEYALTDNSSQVDSKALNLTNNKQLGVHNG